MSHVGLVSAAHAVDGKYAGLRSALISAHNSVFLCHFS